jgi:hypothetical protein
MFCPTCGREDAQERKFCPSCGTNLERVTKALSPNGDSLMVRADQAFDRLIALYAGLFFSGAPAKALDRRATHSWEILGQSFLSVLANFVLFWVMLCAALPLRLITLLFSTPFRLLTERNIQTGKVAVAQPEKRKLEVRPPQPEQWLMDRIPSVAEPTTMNLASHTTSDQTTSKP